MTDACSCRRELSKKQQGVGGQSRRDDRGRERRRTGNRHDLNALRMGQMYSEWMVELSDEQEETREGYKDKASRYYNIAVSMSKTIPREL